MTDEIYTEDRMKQLPVYPTKQTPSYADWNLFKMGQELEEKVNGVSGNVYTKSEIDAKIEVLAEKDLTNVNVGSGNAGRYIQVADDGTLQYTDIPQSGYGFVIAQIDETVLETSPYNGVTYPASVVVDGVFYRNSIDGESFREAKGTDIRDWTNHMLIKGIKPVYIDDGVITDISDKVDMSNWDESKDAFTQFPFNWLSITKSGSKITIIFSDSATKPSASFVDYAFLDNNGIRQNAFHIGCFDASDATDLSSKVGATPLVSTSLTNFISYATTKGTQYDIVTYDMQTYLTALAVVMFKTVDLQGTSDSTHGLGKGITSKNAVQTNEALEFDNNFGMYGDTTDATKPVSFFWIENIFGNLSQWVGGAYIDENRKLKRNIGQRSSTSTFNAEVITGLEADVAGNDVRTTIGSGIGGFCPLTTSGTNYTIGYTDLGRVTASRFPSWGGYYGGGDVAGVFCVNFDVAASNTYGLLGSRLSCKIGSA